MPSKREMITMPNLLKSKKKSNRRSRKWKKSKIILKGRRTLRPKSFNRKILRKDKKHSRSKGRSSKISRNN